MELNAVSQKISAIEQTINRHIIGQERLVKDAVICLLAGGNVLIEGVPGLGKTKLVSTLAKTVGLDFKRIQFTPDLMPADITGTNIYNREQNAFEFQPGPVFSHIVLADEINRATPKTQGAMLEAMQERTVTSGGQTYSLDSPYMVLATQNPIEQEGTYPLPEAQLDRFMFKLLVDFPSASSLTKIVTMTTGSAEEDVSVSTTRDELLAMQELVKTIPLAAPVLDYAMRLIIATHPDQDSATDLVKRYVLMGASPRGAQNIVRGAKVKAIMDGRFNVAQEDINYVAIPVLRHRLALNYEAISDGVSAEQIIDNLIKEVSF